MNGERVYALRSRPGGGILIGLWLLSLSCSVETNVVQRTKRGILQGVVRDGTLGVIEEPPPAEPAATQPPPTADETKVATTDLPPAKASGRTTFGRGLPGVSISAFVDGSFKTATTSRDDPSTQEDEGGFFALKDLPSGVSIPITFSLKDYASVRASFTIPAAISAGGAVTLEDPQLTIEIDLVKALGQLTVNVFADKGPAKGARVLLDLTGGPLVNTSGGNLSGGFDFFREKTADENGQVLFEELPATVIPAGSLVVLPFDLNSDGTADYTTYTNTDAVDLSLLTAGTGIPTLNVNLATANAIGPMVVWTNVAAGRAFSKTENVVIVFSQPIEATTVVATLTASSLKVAFQTTWDPAKVKATLDPLQDLEPGQSYSVSVTSAFNLLGQPLGGFGPLTFPVIEGLSALPSPKVSYWQNPDQSSTRSDTDVDSTTREVDLEWPMVAGALSYIVYAKDNKLNSDWVEIARKGATAGTQFLDMNTSTRLPAEFDAFPGDSTATPFAFGTQVAFAIVAVNRDGVPGVIEAGNALIASDKKPPVVDSKNPTGQGLVTGQINIQNDSTAANISGTTDKLVAVRLNFSEFMDTSTKPTVAILQEGSGSDCASLSTANSGNNTGNPAFATEWAWDANPSSGTAIVKIPAAQDAREDCIQFDTTNVKDSSGNQPTRPPGVNNVTTVHRLQ